MRIEIRRANLRRDLKLLCCLDERIFGDDSFPEDMWRGLECYLVFLHSKLIGCLAFEHHTTVDTLGRFRKQKGTLYIATTGVLPRFQGMGLGRVLMAYEIAYARKKRYQRIRANCRKSNIRMIRLIEEFGFHLIGKVPKSYFNPIEDAVVMELRMGRRS